MRSWTAVTDETPRRPKWQRARYRKVPNADYYFLIGAEIWTLIAPPVEHGFGVIADTGETLAMTKSVSVNLASTIRQFRGRRIVGPYIYEQLENLELLPEFLFDDPSPESLDDFVERARREYNDRQIAAAKLRDAEKHDG